LTIAAIAKASCVFERQDWLDVAIEAFHFVQSAMMTYDGRLLHSWREGRARHLAVLDDYAAMCRAALALHEATGAPSYLECGRRWLEQVEIHYRDRNGGYFFTADDAEALIARAKIAEDSALPSGNGMMLQVLAQLYHLTGESLYKERAEKIAHAFSGTIRQRVLGFSSLLNGMETLREAMQIVVIGEADAADTAALKRVTYGVSRPGRVFNVIAPGTALPRAHPAFGKTLLDHRATAYVCRGAVCSLPIVNPEALAAALREA
jgi:hypothetical protein